MIREYVVKVTDALVPDAFQQFENEWSPEQELVHCKDCKKRIECDYWIEYGDNWFCADGIRLVNYK